MWPHLLSAIVGIWLMAAPSRLDLGQIASNHEHIAGPIIAALGIISVTEVTRSARWAVLVLGLWLIAGAFVLGYAEADHRAARNEIVCGGVLAVTAIFRGKIRQRYGGGWRALTRSGA